MKRALSEESKLPAQTLIKNNSVATKVKIQESEGSADPVFAISKINSGDSLKPHPLSPTDEKTEDMTPQYRLGIRVKASSKVNFTKLSPEEQYIRFKNQAYEIKQLKRQLRKYGERSCERLDASYKKAMEKLQGEKMEFPDQANVIQNLAHAIITGALPTTSLAYAQICTILRDKLNIRYPDAQHSIRLPDGNVPISTLEFNELKKLPPSIPLFHLIVGRTPPPMFHDPVEHFIVAQANLICGLSFGQFASMAMSPQK